MCVQNIWLQYVFAFAVTRLQAKDKSLCVSVQKISSDRLLYKGEPLLVFEV